MTLVLRYVDRLRVISVADTRITFSDERENIIGKDDKHVSKIFFVCGCLVSYSGLAILNYSSGTQLTTRDWISMSLKEALAEGKDLKKAMEDMASLLSGNRIIEPRFKSALLDIRLIGISPAPVDFEQSDDGPNSEGLWTDEGEEASQPGWMLVIEGYITNKGRKWDSSSFDFNAEHYVPSAGSRYTSDGAELSALAKAQLDSHVHELTSTIDIVNHFVAAVRETARLDETVGRAVTASVIPLQRLADGAAAGELRFSERDDEVLADGYVSYAYIRATVGQAIMVPAAQVRFTETDFLPSAGGFAG